MSHTEGRRITIFELMENRSGTQFFKFVEAEPSQKGGELFRNLWLQYKDHSVVKVHNWGRIQDINRPLDNIVNELETRYVVIPTERLERLIGYALICKENATISQMFDIVFTYACVINGRVLVNGIGVTTPVRTCMEDLAAITSVVVSFSRAERARQVQANEPCRKRNDGKYQLVVHGLVLEIHHGRSSELRSQSGKGKEESEPFRSERMDVGRNGFEAIHTEFSRRSVENHVLTICRSRHETSE